MLDSKMLSAVAPEQDVKGVEEADNYYSFSRLPEGGVSVYVPVTIQ